MRSWVPREQWVREDGDGDDDSSSPRTPTAQNRGHGSGSNSRRGAGAGAAGATVAGLTSEADDDDESYGERHIAPISPSQLHHARLSLLSCLLASAWSGSSVFAQWQAEYSRAPPQRHDEIITTLFQFQFRRIA